MLANISPRSVVYYNSTSLSWSTTASPCSALAARDAGAASAADVKAAQEAVNGESRKGLVWGYVGGTTCRSYPSSWSS